MVDKKIQPINFNPIQIIQIQTPLNLPQKHPPLQTKTIMPITILNNNEQISLMYVPCHVRILWSNIKNK